MLWQCRDRRASRDSARLAEECLGPSSALRVPLGSRNPRVRGRRPGPRPSLPRSEVPALTSTLSGPLRAPTHAHSPTAPSPDGPCLPECSTHQPECHLALPPPSPPFPPSTRSPRGSVVPTIRSHARPPLPALPASDPGVHAPPTCASFSGGNGRQRRLPNRACPPPRFPQFFMGVPGISRVLHQSPLSLGRRQPTSPWQPFCRKRGQVFHRPPCKLQRGSALCLLGSVVGWVICVR